MEYDSRTRLPTALDEEDPFLSLAEIKLSLRQMLTIMLGGFSWWIAEMLTSTILPISGLFSGLLWSWLVVAGIYMAIRKKDGRPYEEYLSKKIVFLISDRHFILKDPKASHGLIEDADWEEIEDPYKLMS
jgi:hypothetical protein